jgi:hypothetical protein
MACQAKRQDRDKPRWIVRLEAAGLLRLPLMEARATPASACSVSLTWLWAFGQAVCGASEDAKQLSTAELWKDRVAPALFRTYGRKLRWVRWCRASPGQLAWLQLLLHQLTRSGC